jgi:tRNA(Ile)-lysidine synthase
MGDLQPNSLTHQQPLLAVAFSGGADSTALLINTHERYPEQTIAFHVHHGLQAAADSFVSHCQTMCQATGIPLYLAYVDARSAPGESPEAAARNARYQALIELGHAHGVVTSGGRVLLAQHADDQIETLLIALGRGAGLGGLSAMPRSFIRGGVVFERPLLDRSADSLRAELHKRGAVFIEDPTNQDRSFKRNQIRLDLLPALQRTFPQCHTTFARSVAHLAQANDLLRELAIQDLESTGQPPRIKSLMQLSPNRRTNALRYWLKSAHSAIPSAAQLAELIKQIAACQTRADQIHIKVASGFVVRAGEVLQYQTGLSA